MVGKVSDVLIWSSDDMNPSDCQSSVLFQKWTPRTACNLRYTVHCMRSNSQARNDSQSENCDVAEEGNMCETICIASACRMVHMVKTKDVVQMVHVHKAEVSLLWTSKCEVG